MAAEETRQAVCAVCDQAAELTIALLHEGCPKCGSKKFKQVRKGKLPPHVHEPDPNVAIAEVANGQFVINVDRLFQAQQGEPVVLQDKSGKFRVAVPEQ